MYLAFPSHTQASHNSKTFTFVFSPLSFSFTLYFIASTTVFQSSFHICLQQTLRKPVNEYKIVREKFASQKREVESSLTGLVFQISCIFFIKSDCIPGPYLERICQWGHSEPHPNIMGPPGILGLFVSGSK